MDTPDFPPNSDASKRGDSNAKDIISVVPAGSATRRRKSLRKQFAETFNPRDAGTAVRFTLFDVLLPGAKDLIVEVGQTWWERLWLGDSRIRYRGSTPPLSGPLGHVQYNRYSAPSRMSGPQRAMSRQARARHNFDEIVLDHRAEAEEVLERLYDLVNRYESATVADLYELVGLASSHTDNRWGWIDLAGSGVSRVRGGYLLDLPEPVPLT